MKRIISSVCTLFLLSSCARTGDLQPDEVLKRATDSAQRLQSASYTVSAEFHGTTGLLSGQLDGNVDIAGVMANAGQQLQFSMKGNMDRTLNRQAKTHSTIDSEMVIADEKEVYMRLKDLSIQPPSDILPPDLIGHMLQQWWLMPSTGGNANNSAAVSPDPSMLRMQTSVIRVTQDHGVSTIHRKDAYHYSVTIDPAKMREYLVEVYKRKGKTPTEEELSLSNMTANGELWIDADSFVILRIVWDIAHAHEKNHLEMHIDATISSHNKPVTIAIPENAAAFPSTTSNSVPAAYQEGGSPATLRDGLNARSSGAQSSVSPLR